jgi:outer membrane protein OmpA-like peptidoglycan-associated protein
MFRFVPILTLLATPALACPQYDTVVAAVQSGDKSGAEVLYDQIIFSAQCDDAIREWVGDYLARENFLASLDAASPDAKRAHLNKALKFEKHWRSFAELGRLEWSLGDYAAAGAQFQLALNELSEGDQSHAADTAEIAEVYELATAALALAEAPVDMPRTRSGNTGGIFTTSIRGFEVEEVSLPITFEYDSTEFDAIGAEYAQTLVEHIALSQPAVIALGGHTDPVGPDEYNMNLSMKRAEAVKSFLVANGFDGEVEIAGYGESDIPPAPPGITPGSPEHHRIARRVAFSIQ